MKTGWPPPALAQDDDRGLFKWFSNHLGARRQIRAACASIKQGKESSVELPDIEIVSAEVHAAWMDTKRAQGVFSRKAEDGEELMVDYDQLSEKAKELDRGTVRTVYAAIRRCASAAEGEAA